MTVTLENTRLMTAMDATWPAAQTTRQAGWVLRRGEGGGNRVSAASWTGGEIQDAEAAMTAMGQTPLFRIVPGQDDLDRDLAGLGYRKHEPTVLYAAPAATLVGQGEHTAGAYRATIRPAIMEEVWRAGGIGPERLAIMDRVSGPALFILGRTEDRPCGAAFVGLDRDLAMIHAIEVTQAMRRKGVATLMIEAAARFAQEAGAHSLCLAVTEANTGARAAYERLGMSLTGRYHYRIKDGT